ncbi:thiopurine S-methyltransferase [Legionella birminghamensis]|uniref:Thiopurine S-methyltransferase n=1 Tax=Legionella birminghamensis TaxID=28083 RepID=A0A378IAN1_9GAMM|nr:thiopurine S-methyltransferase [Legionella birminghamensis]KTC75977.1 thiopurine S-methyltransferase [Legionella birminghamensis]STX32103.1 thiopurine S-methyltransferase [Legionella birminghamensis]
MDKNFWLQKWQSKDIGFNQQQPNKLMQRYFPSLKLEPGARIFVPLCGQSIDMLWLAEQGYQVIGVELSELACSAFFDENKIDYRIEPIKNFTVFYSDKITIYAGDFFKISQAMLGSIDAVYDRAALIALPEEMRKLYSNHLTALISAGTMMLLIITTYNQDEMRGPPFSVDEQEVEALYNNRFAITQLYKKPFEVSAHLQARGLKQAVEQAYLLVKG